MRITGKGVWGYPSDQENARDVLRRAVELGIDFIDTADSYGPYVSEELIFEALHPYIDVRIATKAGLLRTGPDVWSPCGLPAYLRQECEMSLRRLGVESLDLFQLHRIDPAVNPDDQFGLLKELLDEGKVKAVGLSEVSVGDIKAAQKVLPISTVQNMYNLSQRQSEDVLNYCEEQSIGFIPWFPVARGELTNAGGKLANVVAATGHTAAQLSLAWLLRRSPVVMPIPGTSSIVHLEENCVSDKIDLSDETYEALTAL
jgi:aryl-alcohol dehydrogenase-like predicted oxidoreductase